MSPTDAARFKQKLQQMKQDLQALESAAKNSTETVVLDQSSVGRLSRMDALQGQQMALATERRRKEQLLRIEAALRRIENDDYGFCIKCDEDIPLGRLEFDPTATHCVTCSSAN